MVIYHITLTKAILGWHVLCFSWWRHQIETFSASLALCAGNSPVIGEFPRKRKMCILDILPELIEAYSDAICCVISGSIWVQVLACRLVGAKPISKHILSNCQLDLRNKLSSNFNQLEILQNIFWFKIEFENAYCKMASVLFRSQYHVLVVVVVVVVLP